jgi:serine protease Do
MKKWKAYIITALAVTVISTSVFSQDTKEKTDKSNKEKSQDIIIRKKGDKTEKMTIVVDNDKVTINGKPLEEFKSADVTVLKRERSDLAGAPRVRGYGYPLPGEDVDIDIPGFDRLMPTGVNKAMLGVVTSKTTDGVKITDVTKESGAAKAGLQKDDIITKIGDTKVNDPKELTEAIGKYKPEDKVEVTYKRSGKEAKTTATLGENKARNFAFNFDSDKWFSPEGNAGGENFRFNINRKPRIGLQIQDLEEGKGVTVKDVDDESPAEKAGLKEGDVITQVDGKEVGGVDELKQQIKDLKEGDTLKVTYKRGGANQTAEIKIPKKLKTADL